MERGEKSEKILEYLRDGIRSGTWDNSLLPKETELASQFGVARGTVRHALEHLVSEGVIERKKRLGTMISRNYNPAKLIGAVLRYGGHFHEDVYAHLQRMTAEAGLCIQAVDVWGFEQPKLRKHIRRGLTTLSSLETNYMILDGYIYKAYPMIDKLLKKNPVFFDYIDYDIPENATGVFIDYYEIGRIGASYLIEKGCKRPLLIDCDGPDMFRRFDPEDFSHHRSKLIMDGFADVLKENGFDPALHIYISYSKKKKLADAIYEIFSHPKSQPDGIYTGNDSSLNLVLTIAKECGYIPKHYIGCLNTDWCRGLGGFTFPSIIVSPEECARALLEQVRTPVELRKNVYIKPYLKSQ